MLMNGEGERSTDPVAAIRAHYRDDITDEFMTPISIVPGPGAAPITVRDGDSVIFFNFRADRARQLTRAFTEEDFSGFERGPRLNVKFTCMTEFDRGFGLPVAFGPIPLTMIFADVLAQHGLKNLRVAETEKYAHVTFFFNGGVEKEFPGEKRILIPSPKVATYDLQPEMSADTLTDTVVEQINSGEFDVVIMNYANPDLVGHTGNLEATIKAIETVDRDLGRVVETVQGKGGPVSIH